MRLENWIEMKKSGALNEEEVQKFFNENNEFQNYVTGIVQKSAAKGMNEITLYAADMLDLIIEFLTPKKVAFVFPVNQRKPRATRAEMAARSVLSPEAQHKAIIKKSCWNSRH